ncbi:Twin-arginine translocation pathway, signal sequence [Syntrophomonas zehnderi OL-4]|uniref:Twin-arginine translocation pathway, signal sequence n=1 Tax=Syntrophomonas zehnderi OL-4 TaxID=690567 RepID=A0A0E4GC66_9FIRM|nr:4Fe-4S dicluster domain-containing protein [Syntrophomonas zehnderi]CFY04860.1 Twin-arginine translocation pathway, signal sequence [Syntrophomonas zehnderi OL-4]
MEITRRSFLKRTALSGVAAAAVLTKTNQVMAQSAADSEWATVINVDKCDGCTHLDTPLCTLACRSKNEHNFPVPEKPIVDYWPQKKHEDWSEQKNLTNRLTPYNWTYVQNLVVEYNGQKKKVHLPRRCMHCENPPCSTLCPFGVNDKTPAGPVVIDSQGCFGGAKCRDVCPWHIPQRQAGVGLYRKVAPDYVGGGVMYKCDMCYDLLESGREPACVSACPRGAITFGPKEEMLRYARQWVQKNNGHIYGDTENGGTLTYYISTVSFDAINKAIMSQDMDQKPGKIHMSTDIKNPLDEPAGIAQGMVIAPLAGLMAAGLSAYQIMKGDDSDENNAS